MPFTYEQVWALSKDQQDYVRNQLWDDLFRYMTEQGLSEDVRVGLIERLGELVSFSTCQGGASVMRGIKKERLGEIIERLELQAYG